MLFRSQDLHAPDDVLDDLDRLPAGQVFDNLAEAWTALGRR